MKNRELNQDNLDAEFKQDYLNINHTVAISAEGAIFKVGDVVGHDGADDEETATITRFTVDSESFDIIAHTERGTGRISFMYHPE